MNQVHGREGLPKPFQVRARYLKSANGERVRDFNTHFTNRPFVAGARYAPANATPSAGFHCAKTVDRTLKGISALSEQRAKIADYTSIKQRTG